MSDAYWIERVGDVDIVGRWGSPGNRGGRRHGYWPQYGGGAEYIEVPLVSYVLPDGRIQPLRDDDSDSKTGDSVAGLFDTGESVEGFFDDLAKPFVAVAKTAKKVGGDIIHTANNVVKFAGKSVVAPVGKAIGHIPVVGPVVSSAAKLTPFYALGNLSARVLSGERLDKAFLNSAKGQLHAVKDLAPYVSQVAAFIPGVGTGIAAALAAGTALAEGRTITQALLDGVKGALPGGPVAKAIFDGGQALMHGQNLTSAAIAAAKSQLPRDVGSAIDVAVKAAKGKNVREAVLQTVRAKLSNSPQQLQAFEKSVALGAARNIQSNVTNKVTTASGLKSLAAQGQKMLANSPASIRNPSVGLSAPALAGYKAGLGLLSSTGVTPHMVVAARSVLGPVQQTGFDHAVKSYLNHFTAPTFTSLVKNGIVTRGNWRASSRNTPGAVYGRHIDARGKVLAGYFVRG